MPDKLLTNYKYKYANANIKKLYYVYLAKQKYWEEFIFTNYSLRY